MGLVKNIGLGVAGFTEDFLFGTKTRRDLKRDSYLIRYEFPGDNLEEYEKEIKSIERYSKWSGFGQPILTGLALMMAGYHFVSEDEKSFYACGALMAAKLAIQIMGKEKHEFDQIAMRRLSRGKLNLREISDFWDEMELSSNIKEDSKYLSHMEKNRKRG